MWLALTITLLLTKAPWLDEAIYYAPALHEMQDGQWSTPEIEPSGFVLLRSDAPLTRIDQRSYWIMPGYPVVMNLWMRIAGPGIYSQRMLSVAAGLATLILWGLIVQALSGSRVVAAVAVLLIGFDWHFLHTATSGRVDILAYLAGLSAFASAVIWYDRHPARACAGTGTALGVTAMMHPNAFFIWSAVIAMWALFSVRKFRFSWLLSFALPAAAILAAYLAWISLDFPAFRDQIGANSSFRGSGFALLNEAQRLWRMYGLQQGIASSVRVYSLLAAAGGISLLAVPKFRTAFPGLKRTVVFAVTAVTVLGIVDATKWENYDIYWYTWLAVPAAFGIGAVWVSGQWRTATMVLMAGYVAITIGLTAFSGYRNTFAQTYLPTVRVMQQIAGPGELVFAPVEFLYDFKGKFLYDVRYGFKTGNTPGAVVVRRSELDDAFDFARRNSPALLNHFNNLFQKRCQTAYSNTTYVVFDCNP